MKLKDLAGLLLPGVYNASKIKLYELPEGVGYTPEGVTVQKGEVELNLNEIFEPVIVDTNLVNICQDEEEDDSASEGSMHTAEDSLSDQADNFTRVQYEGGPENIGMDYLQTQIINNQCMIDMWIHGSLKAIDKCVKSNQNPLMGTTRRLNEHLPQGSQNQESTNIFDSSEFVSAPSSSLPSPASVPSTHSSSHSPSSTSEFYRSIGLCLDTLSNPNTESSPQLSIHTGEGIPTLLLFTSTASSTEAKSFQAMEGKKAIGKNWRMMFKEKLVLAKEK